ncbi:protein FAM166C [Clupea harengus]|uniref:Ciliary microtubule inner protein 2C n=1 Tax=Clupea harengus TaxID=7950 RepID=A0A6P3WAF0_CLUHA|nr:protein FAM166C [Clupea harengus]
MASRQNGTLFTHNNATYIAPALMPGYGGHVPTITFMYGHTYGNTTSKCFQESRFTSMTLSTATNVRGGNFQSTLSSEGHLTTVLPARTRQQELQNFSQLTQRHRENYKDCTGACLPISYFQLPVKESEKYPQETIALGPLRPAEEETVRRYQTLPAGIRTSTDNRVMRDVFFERR